MHHLIFFTNQMDMDWKNDNWQPIRGPWSSGVAIPTLFA
jgi:hypothetical protein